MRVDGREIAVAGSLLQPLTRRTTDIFRLALAGVFLAIVITSSLITRSDWVGLERSISRIVGVLTPFQSNLVYLAYGIVIVALPFVILIGLIAGREWKLLGAYAAAILNDGVLHNRKKRNGPGSLRATTPNKANSAKGPFSVQDPVNPNALRNIWIRAIDYYN